MKRLSQPIETIKEHYDVVVIGSGYGGGIAASRLARAGRKVCLLERGREIQPGEYPDTEPEIFADMQFRSPDGRIGSDTAMFDFHVHKDISVLVGCGLGGTSLINANVAIRPVDQVWDDPHWPAELTGGNDEMAEYYRRAETMLGSNPYPDDYPALPKQEAHRKSADAMGLGECFYKLNLNVSFTDKLSHAGVPQKACINCGDCVSGCNYLAKNTTIMNYLPDARNHGAELFTACSVTHVERNGDRWVVQFEVVGADRAKFASPALFVTADIVVIAAGTLGSTEILLRSRQKGLPLSDHLGKHFSGNGDVLGFAYDCDDDINAVGFGTNNDGSVGPVGPTITSIIDQRKVARHWKEAFVVEEGAIPGALGGILPEAFALAAKLVGKDTGHGVADWLKKKGRAALSWLRGPYYGAVNNTQTYLGMCHDGSEGEIQLLENDRLNVSWPNVGREPIFEHLNNALLKVTTPLSGIFVKNPVWTAPLNDSLVSVHPLGGCCMADDASRGVTNHKGQVFSGTEGTGVHPGLYVADGSIVPVSVGVNPLLTISALAERIMQLIADENGWELEVNTPSRPADPDPDDPPEGQLGVRFTESMKGYFSTRVKDDYQEGWEQGKAAGSAMEFILTIQATDVDQFLADPEHEALMFGTLSCRALSPEPMTVHDGRFNLFVDNPDEVETKNMIYRMVVNSEEGKTYYFHGFKIIHPGSVLSAWPQTTTLYVTVYEGRDDSGPVAGKGILRITPGDFAKQLTTMKAVGAGTVAEKLGAVARFGAYFADVLFETYGGVLVREHYFNPDAAPRKKRPLRAGVPEVHHFATSDSVTLRLTRYQGGKKGPVMLVHGAGVSSAIFSTDLVDTNLVEYLYALGYDVWLFDFRMSVALLASQGEWNGDQIATIDHPEAVAYIRRVTGADSIQAVVHCFGSTTFFMALLAGMQGVRSVVCSQVATHPVASMENRIKAGLHLPSVLQHLGVESLSAYVDQNADWKEKLWDELLRLHPLHKGEDADSAVSRRISFLYGELYRLEQLNQRTFANLHELFGVGNIKAFEHLALMVREKRAVSAAGKDMYLPHLDRLALPITFLHGAENHCYLPESTQLTMDLLIAENGAGLYDRHVIAGYGHLDCIFGKNAVEDVYPHILEHLEKHQ